MFIRKNPYTEDPLEFMLRELEETAGEHGQSISSADKKILREDIDEESTVYPGEEFIARIKPLIRFQIEKDRERFGRAGERHPNKSFLNAMEWAGDMASPILLELTGEVYQEHFKPYLPTLKEQLKDATHLFTCGCLVVVVLFLVSGAFIWIFKR